MSRKFNLTIAGAFWKRHKGIGETLLLFDVELAYVLKMDIGEYRVCMCRRNKNRYSNHKSMSAAKAYVIKSLATPNRKGKQKNDLL